MHTGIDTEHLKQYCDTVIKNMLVVHLSKQKGKWSVECYQYKWPRSKEWNDSIYFGLYLVLKMVQMKRIKSYVDYASSIFSPQVYISPPLGKIVGLIFLLFH